MKVLGIIVVAVVLSLVFYFVAMFINSVFTELCERCSTELVAGLKTIVLITLTLLYTALMIILALY